MNARDDYARIRCNFPSGWTNFYRQDDVSATAYFYLDKPVSGLSALAPVGARSVALRD